MDPVSQPPGPQPASVPTTVSTAPGTPLPPKFNWIVILIGLIALLVVLLGVSFYQVLSLQQQVSKLKTASPQPTPVSSGTVVPVESGVVVSPTPTGGTNELLELTGMIQKSEVEGGCWVINPNALCTGDRCPLSEAPSYEPINLAKELQKVGIKANFKLEVQSDVATVCQLGPAVKILDYQIIK